MSALDNDSVQRVRKALVDAGLGDRVIELDETARTAQDAAASVGCELGAIVKSLAFIIGSRTVLALVAGDHRCVEAALSRCLDIPGAPRRPGANEVKGMTGFTIGGVAPVGLIRPLPIAIDRSLKRFDTLYAAAGHPHCVFPLSFDELRRLTDGMVSWNIAQPLDKDAAGPAPLQRSKTMLKAAEESDGAEA